MDNEVFERLMKENEVSDGILHLVFLNEQLSRDDYEEALANPDIRPSVMDGTVKAWLFRISRWGKMNILFNDPENKVRNKRVDANFMEQRLTDPTLLRMLGQMGIDRKSFNEVKLYREYIGIDGKKYEESFLVKIDLRPDLKKATSWKWF